jgi:MoaA/NifB/PqqE/SkfB family radical SAM enzyme
MDPIFKNISTLTISGGEAFLYEDYCETVKLFIDSMPKLRRLVLNTNGFLGEVITGAIKQITQICDDKSIKLEISISIDGTRKIHERIRGVSGCFDNILKTINDLKKINKKYKFSLGIATLLLNQNIDKFNEIDKWLKKTRIKYNYQLVGFHETFVKNTEKEKEIGFSSKKENLLKVIDNIINRKNSNDFEKYYWTDMKNMYEKGKTRTTPCSFLKDEFVIDCLGDIYYCLSAKSIGNFIKEKRSISEIYYDPKNINFRQFLPKTNCLYCNSGCDVINSLAFDLKRYLWFKVTGKLWPEKYL